MAPPTYQTLPPRIITQRRRNHGRRKSLKRRYIVSGEERASSTNQSKRFCGVEYSKLRDFGKWLRRFGRDTMTGSGCTTCALMMGLLSQGSCLRKSDGCLIVRHPRRALQRRGKVCVICVCTGAIPVRGSGDERNRAACRGDVAGRVTRPSVVWLPITVAPYRDRNRCLNCGKTLNRLYIANTELNTYRHGGINCDRE